MRFEPKTEKEIAEDGLLQAGTYDFEVVKGEDRTSKAGNDMIELVLNVLGDDGAPRRVTDYLMEKIAYKLRHAAEVCGLLRDYEAGSLLGSDFVGRAGRVKLKIQASKGFPDRNSVVDYIVDDRSAQKAPVSQPARVRQSAMASDFDDDIPF